MKARWSIAIACFMLVVASSPNYGEMSSNPAPSGTAPSQGWDPATRQAFYHDTQNSELIPYDWFLALEQPNESKPFMQVDYFKRFGFIPDRQDPKSNPDGLPVGFTRTDPDPKSEFFCDRTDEPGPPVSLAHLGFNCAACHTGQLNYTDTKQNSHTVIIDGGPSMHNNLAFLKAVIAGLNETFVDTDKFGRFAKAVLPKEQPLTPKGLRQCLNKYLSLMTLPDRVAESRGIGLYPSPWGYGRMDAFGRALNTGFARLDPGNVRQLNAPVDYPQLWGAWRYDWVQWNASIQNPMGRNIAQSVGLRATVKFPEKGLHGPVETKVDASKLNGLEQKVRLLNAPRWPAAFPPVVSAKTEQGKGLYNKLCAGCHRPAPLKEANQFGQRYDMDHHSVIKITTIGTDPNHAVNFQARMVRTGLLGGVFMRPTIPAVEATQWLTSTIMEINTWPARDPNYWRAPLAYIARPHAGVWATAPYLHNGSVPTLRHLLSPVEQRPMRFCLGALEFDPVNVGFKNKCAPGELPFDVTLPGNSNAGHEFRNDDRHGHRFDKGKCDELARHGRDGILGCELTDDERMAIIEYLKTCDEENLICDLKES